MKYTNCSQVVSSPTKEKSSQIPKQVEEQKTAQEEKKTSTKPILMTRRELTDPFGSDDEDEPLQNEPIIDSKPAVEVNGSVVNGTDLSPKEKQNDIFADLPKPNIVSNFVSIRNERLQ